MAQLHIIFFLIVSVYLVWYKQIVKYFFGLCMQWLLIYDSCIHNAIFIQYVCCECNTYIITALISLKTLPTHVKAHLTLICESIMTNLYYNLTKETFSGITLNTIEVFISVIFPHKTQQTLLKGKINDFNLIGRTH